MILERKSGKDVVDVRLFCRNLDHLFTIEAGYCLFDTKTTDPYLREDPHIDFCATIVNLTFRMKPPPPPAPVQTSWSYFRYFRWKTRLPVTAPVELCFRFRSRKAYKIRQGYQDQAVLKSFKDSGKTHISISAPTKVVQIIKCT